MTQEAGLYIGGKWTNPRDRKRFETTNPATGQVLATFPMGTAEDVNAAVKAAKGAFEKWRKTPAPRRGELLLEVARILKERKEDIARTVTMEMGKILAEGRGDVKEAIDFFQYAAGEGRRMFGETVPSELPNKACLTIRMPVGPVGLITPWNFPVAIPAWKSGAALIAGCPIVFKPSSLTPLCAAKFVDALDAAGFPPGVVNMVTGSGSVVGDGIVQHPGIRAGSFTGGVGTGRHGYESAAGEGRGWGDGRGLVHGGGGQGPARVREGGEEDDQGRARARREERDHRDGRRGPRPPDGRGDVRGIRHGGSAVHGDLPPDCPPEDVRRGRRRARGAGGEAAGRGPARG